MNLTLDIGNTAVKWATFEGRRLVESGVWDTLPRQPQAAATPSNLEGELKNIPVDKALICASGDLAKVQPLLDSFNFPACFTGLEHRKIKNNFSEKFSIFNSSTPLPIKLDYKTPETLGADRIADACGAAGLHPGEACLIIDAGTCITVDFLDAKGVYHGGAIMPGLRMNLQALHTFTAKLPLIDIEGVEKAPVLGRSTEESILAGTLGATLLALAGYVALYKEKAPGLRVLLTGGDAERLMASGANGWGHVPYLTLIGMNEILIYNEK